MQFLSSTVLQEDVTNVHELNSLHPVEGGHGCPIVGVSVIFKGGRQPLLPSGFFVAEFPDFLSQDLPALQLKLAALQEGPGRGTLQGESQ